MRDFNFITTLNKLEAKYRYYLQKIQSNKWYLIASQHFKDLYDKTVETNSELKIQFLQFLPFFVASFLTGFVAYVYSRLFTYSEKLSFFIYEKEPLLVFVVTPVTFLLSWFMVNRFAKFAKGSGIPQVMASLESSTPGKKHLIQYLLSIRILVVKVLSSFVKVIGGGIAGREGPTIQIAASIFNEVYNRLPKWWIPINHKNILIAGAASGLSAAFNTPLGGIIFAIEELSKYHIKHYKSTLFIAVIIAGITAQGFGGSYLYLGYPKTNYSGWMVYLGIILVAIVTGYFGSKMCQYMLIVIRYVNKLKNNKQQMGFVIVSALFVATFIYFFGTDAMGSGKEIMERTLFSSDKKVDWYLPFIRMNGLIASFSFGGAGGVFAPSLSSGATFGALIAQFLHLTGDNANLLILIGMTSFLSAVTRAPFTASIIIFEMTDKHSIIFFLLLGSLIASMIASRVEKSSFYDILKENYIVAVEKKHEAKLVDAT